MRFEEPIKSVLIVEVERVRKLKENVTEIEEMNCIVCENIMEPFFEKEYGNGKKHYFVRCPNCGLVINSTVYNMGKQEWEEVNSFHIEFQGEVNMENELWKGRMGRLKPQANFLSKLLQEGVIPVEGKNVDWGCGDGLLSDLVDEEYMCNTGSEKRGLIGKYEKYLARSERGYYSEKAMIPGMFDTVISTAVLEHMIGIQDVDSFLSLAKPKNGIVIIHTLVCNEVPCDPDWFYIKYPIHCTIWTNKAMALLFERYGFIGCAYHLESKMWLLYKDKTRFEYTKERSDKILGEWTFSNSFVDYWKNPPYRK